MVRSCASIEAKPVNMVAFTPWMGGPNKGGMMQHPDRGYRHIAPGHIKAISVRAYHLFGGRSFGRVA